MDKKAKEKFTAHPNSLYNEKWVEKAATKRFENYYKVFLESIPEYMRKEMDSPELRYRLSLIYYTAFEDALNTFMLQMLNDTVTDMKLCMDELGKVTARIKKK